MDRLEINDMIFFSRHGCFDEEKKIGNKFIVHFSAETDMTAAAISDSLDDAVDYQKIYKIIKEEMGITSNILENVGGRILKRIREAFPSLVSAEISISKLNPPIGGQVGSFKVSMSYGNENQ